MFRRLKEFLVGAMVVGGLMVGGKVSALTYSSNVGVQFTFNSSLQVNVSADLIISNLSPGTDSDSNIIDVVVKTNNATGYTLNATVGNNTTYNTRNLVHEVSGSSANFASINYGSSMASLSADNTWGYSYSTNNGSTWSNYDGLPLYSDATNIATLKTATGPASTNAGDKVNFKIAAKAATSQYSGEYNNVINFVATANPVPTLGPVACEANKICYNANALDPTEVEGTMGKQINASGAGTSSNITGNTDVTLLASNFSREGYGFAGWSDTYDYAYNPSANLYGPQEDIVTPADMSGGLPLYAIWIPSAGSMQTDAATTCSGLTAATNGLKSLSSVSALTDQRDGETYAIAKLADGNCWMIENLRLADIHMENGNTVSTTLTTTNTNNPLNDGTNVTLKHNYNDINTFTNLSPTSATSYDADTSPEGWCHSGSADCIDQSRINTSNTTNRVKNFSRQDANIYSYGNYYNWYSATAGNGVYDFTTNNNSVGGDLCPSGWHLPTGGMAYASDDTGGVNVTGDPSTFREFYYLSYRIMDEVKTAYEDSQNNGLSIYTDSTVNAMGDTAMRAFRKYPNNFLYSGLVFVGELIQFRGSGGYYWSSTTRNRGDSNFLYIHETELRPGTTSYPKYYGRTVRCIIGS